MDDPLVSVLVPTYNSQAYVERAIKSAIDQTCRDLEIIVQDNASTDRTWEIVTSYAEKDSRLKCARNLSNVGPLRNWQLGLKRCTGEYLKILWSDDWMEPLCVEACVEALKADNEAGFVFTGTIIHGLEYDAPVYFYPDRRSFDIETYLVRAILFQNMPVSPSCALIRSVDGQFQTLPGSNRELQLAGLEIGAGPDILFLLMTAIKYKRILHIPRFHNHFQARPECFTISEARLVQHAYEETLKLFVRDIAEPKFARLPRALRIARALRNFHRIRKWMKGPARIQFRK